MEPGAAGLLADAGPFAAPATVISCVGPRLTEPFVDGVDEDAALRNRFAQSRTGAARSGSSRRMRGRSLIVYTPSAVIVFRLASHDDGYTTGGHNRLCLRAPAISPAHVPQAVPTSRPLRHSQRSGRKQSSHRQ